MHSQSDGATRHSKGTVYKKTLGHYFVDSDGETVVCSISNKLRKELIYPIADASSVRQRVIDVQAVAVVDPVAVGDRVGFLDNGDGSGMIVDVLPRRTQLVRRAPGPKPLEQVIVANVDQIVTVFAAAQPKPKWNLLDRYLVTAEAAGLPTLICITKWDLVKHNAKSRRLQEAIELYQHIGYPVILTSSVDSEGLAELRDALCDRLSVFVGKSGVGKTTLLNALQPGLGLRVKEISQQTGKGKHTTSHVELFELDAGGQVVDTPGMREFALWDLDGADLAALFPEMTPYLGQCRFGASCSHTHEPECAIKEAVAAGEIAECRYDSFVRMQD
jgi:ribosome biogenesis GTPase